MPDLSFSSNTRAEVDGLPARYIVEWRDKPRRFPRAKLPLDCAGRRGEQNVTQNVYLRPVQAKRSCSTSDARTEGARQCAQRHHQRAMRAAGRRRHGHGA